MIESPYYIVNNQSEKFNFNSTIERYSDKYSKKKKLTDEWTTGIAVLQLHSSFKPGFNFEPF